MRRANEIALYFIRLSEMQDEESISNLKLQKLLYYSQGLHLALYDQCLFPEPIEAWMHGPVVPKIYQKYKANFSKVVSDQNSDAIPKFTDKEREVLDEVYNVYGQYSAWKLREMTHDELPWKDTPKGAVITPQLMKDYFKTLVIENG